jgi:hypothetical protein
MWTPNNPNPAALKRVKDAMPVPVTCNHCGGNVYWTNNAAIYGKSYGDWPYIYACECCEARVGMHPETNIPLGTLATAEERDARKKAKAVFLAWSEANGKKRGEAYAELAKRLGMTAAQALGEFNTKDCARVIVLFTT